MASTANVHKIPEYENRSSPLNGINALLTSENLLRIVRPTLPLCPICLKAFFFLRIKMYLRNILRIPCVLTDSSRSFDNWKKL